MSFDLADYRRGAGELAAPTKHLMAVAAVESSGETFWTIGNRQVPPIRLEAHWFGTLTGYRYNASHPHLSARGWNPALAAKTKSGAWAQYEEAAALDAAAAAEACSWAGFQIMGFHWQAMKYPSVAAFVDDVDGPDDDGQMDMFVRFVRADGRLLRAIRAGDWDAWELAYNGGGYGGAYAAKIRNWLTSNGGGDAGAPAVPRVLRKGCRGSDVAALQMALGVTSDGDFGAKTEEAVKLFQADRGLVVDAIVGVMTLRALGLAA